MKQWDKNNLIYIMAPTGHARKAIEKKGIIVYSPYFGDKIPARILREICFRIPILPKSIWYRKINIKDVCYINVIDINITSHYLQWLLRRVQPDTQINFIYDNMVGKARNINPSLIPSSIRVWTYDDYDSRKYGIRLQRCYWIKESLIKKKQDPEYDVFFVGKDKGRGERLIALEKEMNKLGLRTKFIITKDKKYSRNKEYYHSSISYDEVLELDTRSRAILNVTMNNQEGITLRDMEATAMGIKLITTNRNIINKDMYSKKNVFILGVDDFRELPEFLNIEYDNIFAQIKSEHTFEAMIEEITNPA